MRTGPVIDAHCDTLVRLGPGTSRRLGSRLADTQIDLPRLKESGVTAQFFACCVDAADGAYRPTERALRLIDVFHSEIEANPDSFVQATGPDGVLGAVRDGRVAGILAIEGGEALGGDLAVLRILHRLGVRVVTLTWNHRNSLADGLDESGTGGGLTRFGVDVVREMGRLGMLVDVSHLSEAGFWRVMEVAEGPVIATHSNARAVCDHPRNLTDDQIRALAAKGGVMGLNSCGPFVSERAGKPGPDGQPQRAEIADLVDHADHIIRLVGGKHLGFGLDLDGIRTMTAGLEEVTGVPHLVRGLLERGHDPGTVRDIMGGNFLRAMKEAAMA